MRAPAAPSNSSLQTRIHAPLETADPVDGVLGVQPSDAPSANAHVAWTIRLQRAEMKTRKLQTRMTT